jgi:hypothetical protein
VGLLHPHPSARMPDFEPRSTRNYSCILLAALPCIVSHTSGILHPSYTTVVDLIIDPTLMLCGTSRTKIQSHVEQKIANQVQLNYISYTT